MPAANRKDKSLSIRFTPEERALLVRLAAGSSLASYIRRRALDEQVSPRRRGKTTPLHDEILLAQFMGEFGRTRIPNNLNQIAHAINAGWVVMPSKDSEATILEACGSETCCSSHWARKAIHDPESLTAQPWRTARRSSTQ